MDKTEVIDTGSSNCASQVVLLAQFKVDDDDGLLLSELSECCFPKCFFAGVKSHSGESEWWQELAVLILIALPKSSNN